MTELDEALTILQNRGFKKTPQRINILEYLIQHRIHPSAMKIADSLAMNLTTVYNTLDVLIASKLVYPIDNNQDGKKHYDYFVHPHYHVICRNCGRIVDGKNIDLQNFPTLARQASGYLIEQTSLEFTGLCPACQKLLDIN
ncbi:peroxide operon transcriptional regulator [Weissella oryzae SG25]|uniref:Peroxide operon transcriptional regulator n=1 Tax=Weissella oryzae (strain DSM 25784 / JCM 18191 / LMG 30913 / SG25) TaxID=1329250 RepID=A0A069CUY0_WEIOS|nr:Fur family transcriptional regulator [Weissella oryzae]GAK31202.1 peroxide operon transcriptional regulator [Weissella oryzae SG25]